MIIIVLKSLSALLAYIIIQKLFCNKIKLNDELKVVKEMILFIPYTIHVLCMSHSTI